MQIEEVRKLADQVEGWLTDKEGELLYNLARNCTGRGVIIEIGSWKGKSTVWLGQGSERGKQVKIYAVDPHTGSSEHRAMYGEVWTFEEFKKNIQKAQVDHLVVPLVKTSQEAARGFNQPVELIFIDGAHEYDFVKLDFDLWFPKLIEGGFIAFHDSILGPGVKKVVKEKVFKSKDFRKIGLADYITYAQKVRENTAGDRLRNKFILLLRNMYEFAAKLQLPKPIRKAGKRVLRFIQ